jgi:ATP-dependent RNA helicase DeaD
MINMSEQRVTMRFKELRVKQQIIKNAERLEFEKLTKIQERSINKILDGMDVVGQAETGSGKTVAFALPILEMTEPRRGIQALVLTPTRELCVQITDVFEDLGRGLGINVTSVYGGVGIDNQIRKLHSTEIVIGTPGRILDHMNRGTINLRGVRFLVLDETDRMLDMGFIDDVEKIISQVPRKRQTLMFSATMHGLVDHIIDRHLYKPVFVYTRTHVDKSKMRQVYYEIGNQNLKFSLLVHLLKNSTQGLTLVFCATRTESDIVARNLRRNGLNASTIHGGMSQQSREKSMDALKNERTDILVATDVAARGIDIKNVTHVYNYDVPKTSKEYIHRIGRTARAGEEGDAVTLLTHKDHDNFRRVLRDVELDIQPAEMPHFKRVVFERYSRGSPRSFSGRKPYQKRRAPRRW